MRFRNFIHNKSFFIEMAMSKPQMRLPITHELADLISLVHGQTLRARALNWILSTGLMEASMNREKLCDKVNQIIKGENLQKTSNLGVSQQPKKPFSKQQQIVGEVRSINSIGMYNINKNPDRFIDPMDLFSPVARKRMPELETILIDGLSIDEYYHKNYEPKIMTINSSESSAGRGKMVEYDLEELRNICKSKFGTTFVYGGVNGYIQFVEKGDGYLTEPEIRDYANPNEQYGYILRPEYKNIDDEKTDLHKDISGFNSRKNPVYHFAGGPISPDENRARETIEQMDSKFRDIVHSIESDEETDDGDIPKERLELIKNNIKNEKSIIKKLSYKLGDKGVGRGAYHTRFNIPNYNTKKGINIIPKHIDMEFLKNMIWAGLNEEIKNRDPNNYINLEEFGKEWDGQGNPPPIEEGYYRFDEKGKLHFRLPLEIRKKAWNIITSSQEENPRALNVNFPFHKLMPNVVKDKKENSPGKNSNLMLNINSLFNAALGNKKIFDFAKDIDIKSYHLDDIDPSIYANKQHFEKFKLEPQTTKIDHKTIYSVDNDKFIKELLENGFKWDLKSSIEKKTGKPDWSSRKWAILSFPKGREYRVTKEKENEFFIYVPSGQKGDVFSPKGFSYTGKSLLGGGKGVEYHGGLGGGHVEVIPSTKKTTDKLIDELKNGEFGEGNPPIDAFKPKSLPIYDETELPCVRTGVAFAKNYFKTHKGKTTDKEIDSDLNEYQLLGFGVQALRNFAGDPAFQVGYLTLEELNKFLKTDFDKEYEKEIIENPGLDSNKGGRGINALLNKAGLKLDDEDGLRSQEEIINDLITQIRNKKPIIKWNPRQGSELSKKSEEEIEKIKKAIGDNAFYARVRWIRNFVLTRMNEIDKENRKSGSMPFAKSKEGEESQFDFDDRNYEAENDSELQRKEIHPSHLFKLAGKEYGKMPIQQNVAKPKTITKKSVQDDVDWDEILSGLKQGNVTQQQKSIPQQQDDINWDEILSGLKQGNVTQQQSSTPQQQGNVAQQQRSVPQQQGNITQQQSSTTQQQDDIDWDEILSGLNKKNESLMRYDQWKVINERK